MEKVKVRFAPSPTGPLHIGGARSALFNYLEARHTGGSFIVRIEDTDLERSKREFEDEIIKSLQWLGLDWDEGIVVGGENGPYRQTERLEIYQKYVQKLLEEDKAYYCFCTEEELDAEREQQMQTGALMRYSGKCSHLSKEEVEKRIAAGEKPAIRLRVAPGQTLEVHDRVRGDVRFDTDTMGDFIIVKNDGIPVYNFAVVLDDVLMGVSLVMRAEEHLSNTPRQLLIYQALGFEAPEFAHVSLILGSDHQKMSKRHGATSVMAYREMGYLPEAMFNFLALLGWSPEGEQEIMTPEEIIAQFDVSRVSKSPAVFDLDKLNYMNQQHIKRLSIEELMLRMRPYLEDSEFAADMQNLSPEKYEVLAQALHDRLVCLADVKEQAKVFLRREENTEEAQELLAVPENQAMLTCFAEEFAALDFTEAAEIKSFVKKFIKAHQFNAKNVYMPLRSALTGVTHGPDLPWLILFWGKEETLKRIQAAL